MGVGVLPDFRRGWGGVLPFQDTTSKTTWIQHSGVYGGGAVVQWDTCPTGQLSNDRWTSVSLGKCPIGQLSHWTTVPLDNCPVGQPSLSNLSNFGQKLLRLNLHYFINYVIIILFNVIKIFANISIPIDLIYQNIRRDSCPTRQLSNRTLNQRDSCPTIVGHVSCWTSVPLDICPALVYTPQTPTSKICFVSLMSNSVYHALVLCLFKTSI